MIGYDCDLKRSGHPLAAGPVPRDANKRNAMAVFRCNKCGCLEELPREAVGIARPCPRCGTPNQAYDTVMFVGKVLEKYFTIQAELGRMRDAATNREGSVAAQVPTSSPETFDLHNSSALSSELQHGPIQDWFHRRHIQVRHNPRAVDTTGFFDEVGAAIGKDYSVLEEVVGRIRFAQLKGFASSTIHLKGKSAEDAKAIVDFCRQLYDYSFVAKCFHLKQEQILRVVLQTAPAIREFFNGAWLEWYVFMEMLHAARRHRRRYSCARNLVISLQNGETYELDEFFLLDGERPIYIECKSGEFRQDIDRCLTSSPASRPGIPTALRRGMMPLLSRFGGFLLLAVLLRRSLHRLTGRVPPLEH